MGNVNVDEEMPGRGPAVHPGQQHVSPAGGHLPRRLQPRYKDARSHSHLRAGRLHLHLRPQWHMVPAARLLTRLLGRLDSVRARLLLSQ